MGYKKEVLAKLDELSKQQIQHTIELARNTVILNEHHVRSSNLEARFKPLEESHVFASKFSRILASIVALAAGAAATYHYLFIK